MILNRGSNTVIRATVRSEDGSETLVYIVTVYRERTDPSDVATLSSLSLSGATLSPGFASATTSYRARARYATNVTTVSYTASDIGATVLIQDDLNGMPAAVETGRTDNDPSTPGHQVNLTAGVPNVIWVVVTAENASDEKNYKITIYRENFVKSDNALLAPDNGTPGLVIRSGGSTGDALSTAAEFTYDENTMSYPSVRVANSVGQVTVSTSADHLGAVAVTRPSDQRPDDDNPGHQVLLGAGAKTDITVVVTAEDGRTRETYSVTIYRERRAGAESSDATLSSLSLSGVALSPAFASARGTYRGTAVYDTSKTTVSYMTSDVGATVVISDINTTTDGGTARMDNDSAPGHQVSLTAGAVRDIYLIVTAEGDGPDDLEADDTKIYQITIYRENFVKSDNALWRQTMARLVWC